MGEGQGSEWATTQGKTRSPGRQQDAPIAPSGDAHLLSFVYSLKTNKKKWGRSRGVIKRGEVKKTRASGRHKDSPCCWLHPRARLLPHRAPLGEREVGWGRSMSGTQRKKK